MIVAHYEVGEVIGVGGMGTVYAAVDRRLGRTVAVKLLHPHLARDADVVRWFRTEAVIGAKLSHPHVVRVYDVLETEGVVGFVMEHVDGKSLDRLLGERPGGLPANEGLRLFRQVVSGVAHAHVAGLVHRDIKPSNVLVEVLDGELHARVTDFGVAKVVGGETRLTGMGAKIGTLAYMSPEQIENPASVDARSDVYSLGVLAYEMLTGLVPFEAGTEFEAMRKILAGELRSIRLADERVGAPLASVLSHCLATRAADRFEDARALLGALTATTRVHVPPASPSGGVSAERLRGEDEGRSVHARGTAVPGPTPAVRPEPAPGSASAAGQAGLVASAPSALPRGLGLLDVGSLRRVLLVVGAALLATVLLPRGGTYEVSPNSSVVMTSWLVQYSGYERLWGNRLTQDWTNQSSLAFAAWGVVLLAAWAWRFPRRVALVLLAAGLLVPAYLTWLRIPPRGPQSEELRSVARLGAAVGVMLCAALLAKRSMDGMRPGKVARAVAVFASSLVFLDSLLSLIQETKPFPRYAIDPLLKPLSTILHLTPYAVPGRESYGQIVALAGVKLAAMATSLLAAAAVFVSAILGTRPGRPEAWVAAAAVLLECLAVAATQSAFEVQAIVADLARTGSSLQAAGAPLLLMAWRILGSVAGHAALTAWALAAALALGMLLARPGPEAETPSESPRARADAA